MNISFLFIKFSIQEDVYLDRPTQSIWSHWEQNSHDKMSNDFPKAFLVTAHTGALFSNTLIVKNVDFVGIRIQIIGVRMLST